MILKFKEFTNPDLKYEKRIFDSGLGNFSLDTKENYNYQPIATVLKNRSLPICELGVSWHYSISHLNKEILNLYGDIIYSADISDRSNENEAIDKMIKESYGRFSNEFDKVRPAIGIGNPLLPLEESKIIQIRLSLIEHLNSRLSA